MTKKTLYIASAAITAASIAAIVTYSIKKATKKPVSAGLLILGSLGIAAGAALSTKPSRDAVKELGNEPLLDEEDTDLMQVNISEILGNTADRGTAPEKLRHIEVDEETTIEDFI